MTQKEVLRDDLRIKYLALLKTSNWIWKIETMISLDLARGGEKRYAEPSSRSRETTGRKQSRRSLSCSTTKDARSHSRGWNTD